MLGSPTDVYFYILTRIFLAEDTSIGHCSTGDIRLSNYTEDMLSLTRAGLLEVCINNAWGTVCDSSFDTLDATVACAQLEGFSSTGADSAAINKRTQSYCASRAVSYTSTIP